MSETKPVRKANVHASVIGGRTRRGTRGGYGAMVALEKADASTQLIPEEDHGATWLTCPYSREGLRALVTDSTILPQCIHAYANNIAGYGIALRYREDIEDASGNPEAAAEMEAAEQVLDSLCADEDLVDVFIHLLEARETYGTAYLEVMRNIDGTVRQIEFIEGTELMQKSRRDDDYTTAQTMRAGIPRTYRKRFCRYKEVSGGKTVYYRQFGDPRVMSRFTGEYTDEPIPPEEQANEILEFPIGTTPYGLIRWSGQLLGVDGAQKAEGLNNNYFYEGRHTPMMILIRGGMLDEESEARLEEYMDAVKGEAGQHKYIVLTAEPTGEVTFGDESGQNQPQIEIVPLANILQHDELFQEYIDRKRMQVQSAFSLPDLYVGYTREFNRATAQMAMEVTEKQVFQKERRQLAWVVNNKLLADFGFRYVEAYFLEPDITNPDDLYKLLSVCNNAGGVTPNKAREIIYSKLGDQAEPYDAEWGDVPLQIGAPRQNQDAGGLPGMPGMDLASMAFGLGKQVRKARDAGEDDRLIEVMMGLQDVMFSMAGGAQ